jgi:hypothetical protein
MTPKSVTEQPASDPPANIALALPSGLLVKLQYTVTAAGTDRSLIPGAVTQYWPVAIRVTPLTPFDWMTEQTAGGLPVQLVVTAA